MADIKTAQSARTDTEPPKDFLDQARENANVIFAGALLILFLVFVILWRGSAGHERDMEAWNAIRESDISIAGAENISFGPGPEELKALREVYRGTTAEPFILLQYGNALYKRGKRDDLEEAKQVFADIEKRFPNHPLIGAEAKNSSAAIAGEIELLEAIGVKADSDDEPAEGSADLGDPEAPEAPEGGAAEDGAAGDAAGDGATAPDGADDGAGSDGAGD